MRSIGATILTVVLLLAAHPVRGQEGTYPNNYVEDVTNAGTSAAAFLQIGVGARAQAMGNASAALAHDATALFWNPAAATLLEGTANVTFDHTNWFADTQLDYVGATINLAGVGVIGLSVLNFQMLDEQPVRTVEQPEGTGEYYSASDLALAATYAVALTNRFSAGLTAKFVQEQLWNETASAYAVDFGVLYRTNLPGLHVAASITNFGSDMQLDGRDLMRPYDDAPEHYSNDQLNARLDTDAFSLPLYFRFGLSYAAVQTDMHRITLATDLLHPSDNSESINVGGEYTFWNTISFRGGVAALFEEDRTGGSTFGLGLQRELAGALRLTADYTYANWGFLDDTHRITISIGR